MKLPFPQITELDINLKEFVEILLLQADVTVTLGAEFGLQFTHSFCLIFSKDHKAAVRAI